MKIKTALLTLVAATCFVAVPTSTSFASGGSGGGGGVAGKCGTITSISASPVKLSSSGTASVLQIKSQVNNCSIYLQRYWIDFAEPTNTNTTCKAAFSVFPSTVWSSGSTQSVSASGNITPTPASAEGCVGTHTVRATLRSRTDGSVLSTVNVNYTVSL